MYFAAKIYLKINIHKNINIYTYFISNLFTENDRKYRRI